MVKRLKKPQEITNSPKISPNLSPKLDGELPKSRQQINQENYQKNKEKRNTQAKERYHQQKNQVQLTIKQIQTKYYQAEAIKILMSFKDYTELNKEKKKLWLDFNWTFQNCQKSFSEGYADVVMIMKLAQVADNLIRDYRETAKSEERQRGKYWNSLDYGEQQKLIRYWGYEKARIENGYIDTAEKLERQSQDYLKDIELAKFHEERGKKGCECYQCEEQKKIQGEIKEEMNQVLKDYDQKSGASEKEQCPECKKWVKKLEEESGACKSCQRNYE